jgi:peptide-methionine (S)-S-oxide reductase
MSLSASASPAEIPPSPDQTPDVLPENAARLVLGAGCFWCIEGVYQEVPGVLRVTSGFAGGHVTNPTYQQVTSGETGHAEVVEIFYDPQVVTETELIKLFWQIHDPTDATGVWPDFGPMYRSILLAADEEQKQRLIGLRDTAQADYDKPIATEISLLGEFYPAEDYHQDFVRLNPTHPYVQRIAQPKMEKATRLRQAE